MAFILIILPILSRTSSSQGHSMTQYGWDNCPQEARRQVQQLIDGAVAILGEEMIGVYLHGSLAMGCFNLLRSDMDLLVVTLECMTVETKRALVELLLDTSRASAPIEISFLAIGHLFPWRHPTPFDLHFSEDWRKGYRTELESENWRSWNDKEHCDPDLAAHVTVTRRRGIALYGRPIATVFPEPPQRDYLASVMADVLHPNYGIYAEHVPPVYSILNACRTLSYLRTGQVMSKDEGGVWALGILPEAHRALVIAALEAYREDFDDWRVATLDRKAFAHYIHEEIGALLRPR